MAKEVVKSSLTANAVAKLKVEDAEKFGSLSDNGVSLEVQYDFGIDKEGLGVADAIKRCGGGEKGEKVLLSLYKGHLLFTIQGKMRSLAAQGKTSEQIQEALDKWTPGMAPTRKSAVEKERDRLNKLSPEEKQREIDELQKLLADMKKG